MRRMEHGHASFTLTGIAVWRLAKQGRGHDLRRAWAHHFSDRGRDRGYRGIITIVVVASDDPNEEGKGHPRRLLSILICVFGVSASTFVQRRNRGFAPAVVAVWRLICDQAQPREVEYVELQPVGGLTVDLARDRVRTPYFVRMRPQRTH